MKLSLAILLSIGILISFYTSGKAESKTNDLIDLIHTSKNSQINIASWTIYSRSEIGIGQSEAEMEKNVEDIKKDKKEYQWNLVKKEANHHYLWEGIKLSSNQVVERIKLTAVKSNGAYTLSIAFEIHGQTLKKETVNKYIAYLEKEDEVFYTVRGEANKGNVSELAENIVKNVDGKIIEQLEEPSFISISAYSNDFEGRILTNNNEMNVQIGLRQDPNTGNIDVTIGTPIITTEY